MERTNATSVRRKSGLLRLRRGIRKLYGGGSVGCQWSGMELGGREGKLTLPMAETRTSPPLFRITRIL